ncbi:hypothetical protein HYV74_02370 [Candidatus Uhrbacteria bacterium]|nr:hypothetical protein [Candidatus Uhrbacteria bacterium]
MTAVTCAHHDHYHARDDACTCSIAHANRKEVSIMAAKKKVAKKKAVKKAVKKGGKKRK